MTGEADGLATCLGAFYPRDCDHIGHVNVAAYGAKFDEANWVFFCRIGLTPSYLRSAHYGMAGVQQNITYKQAHKSCPFPQSIRQIAEAVLAGER